MKKEMLRDNEVFLRYIYNFSLRVNIITPTFRMVKQKEPKHKYPNIKCSKGHTPHK